MKNFRFCVMLQRLNPVQENNDCGKPLIIVHCVRSIVGGIFRHINDLIRHQSANGHRVGLICDSLTGGAFEAEKLEALKPYLALGVVQLPMSRSVSISDLSIVRSVGRLLHAVDVDVLHCHGAKGGAYGRFAAYWVSKSRGRKIVTIYSPHGGSLHYNPRSPQGRVYFALERFLENFTSEFIFVAGFEVSAFTRKIGALRRPWSIAYNGLSEPEFIPVKAAADAVDFVYAGHMRDLKGADLFIDAIEIANARAKRSVYAEMIGDGEDRARYEAEVRRRGLQRLVQFRDPMPIRNAFARGRNLVVPSRAEAMPYVVLEAIGGAVPTLATSVGGVPEIFGPHAGELIAPGDANLIASSMLDHLNDPQKARKLAMNLRKQISTQFTIQRLHETVDGVYMRHMSGRRVSGREQKEAAALKLVG